MGKLSHALRNELENHANHIDYNKEGKATISTGVDARLDAVLNNPAFTSQYDLEVSIKYFTASTGLLGDPTPPFTEVTDLTTLPIKTKLPFFLFGKSDSESGYVNCFRNLPVSLWEVGKTHTVVSDIDTFEVKTIAGGDVFLIESPSKVAGYSEKGDYVIPYWHYENQRIWVAEVIVNCKQVGYGTLLQATNSDRFIINMIRYSLPDATKLSQFGNNIFLLKQSLFGKITTDKVGVNAFRTPQDYHTNLIDIPLTKGIDKESALGHYLDYDIGSIDLSIFVPTQNKVVQDI